MEPTSSLQNCVAQTLLSMLLSRRDRTAQAGVPVPHTSLMLTRSYFRNGPDRGMNSMGMRMG